MPSKETWSWHQQRPQALKTGFLHKWGYPKIRWAFWGYTTRFPNRPSKTEKNTTVDTTDTYQVLHGFSWMEPACSRLQWGHLFIAAALIFWLLVRSRTACLYHCRRRHHHHHHDHEHSHAINPIRRVMIPYHATNLSSFICGIANITKPTLRIS